MFEDEFLPQRRGDAEKKRGGFLTTDVTDAH
jgi:hypothetical protein